MKINTAMSEALRHAGVDTDAALLFNIATDLLHRNEVSKDAARAVRLSIGTFVGEVRDAGGIMSALISYEFTRNIAFEYLQRIAADMNSRLRVSEGVLTTSDSQSSIGATGTKASPQGEGSVHQRLERQLDPGASQNREGDDVLGQCVSRSPVGPSSSQSEGNDAVLAPVGGHFTHGRAVPLQNRPRGLEARQAMREGFVSVFDTIRIRDGRAIGDVRFGELAELTSTNKREAALLSLIQGHAQVHAASVKVREVIKENDLQRMIKQAEAMTDA